MFRKDTDLKTLFKYLRNYKKEAVLAPLFKMLEAIFELLVPLVVAQIIDKGIGEGDNGTVIKMCLVLFALGIIGLLSAVVAQYFSARAATGAAAELKSSLLDKIQSMSYTALDRTGIATLITRITGDVNQVQTGINLTLRLLLRSPFVVAGAVVMAFLVDARSALVFAVVVPILAVVIFGILLVTIPMYKRVQGGVDGVTGGVRENLTGVRVIRAFRKEKGEIYEFDADSAALVKIQTATARISSLLNPLTYAIISLGIVALLFDGARGVDTGRITQGELFALHGYMSQILVELVKFANLVITITKSIAGAKRINEVLEATDEGLINDTSANTESDAFVELKNVSLRYSGAGDETLRGISFKVNRGDSVGIIGSTGSGKSSLVNLIGGFYTPSEGDVVVGGINTKNDGEKRILSMISVVPQKAALFSGTVRSNVVVGKRDADEGEIRRALHLAQADELITEERGGLDAPVSQNGKNLSGGQRQRLTIARALVSRPEILILDDSASALDLATEASLRHAIASLERTTVFTVSQRASSVMGCDLIVVLENGEAVGIGTHAELMDSCEVYREIYYSQFEDGEVRAK